MNTVLVAIDHFFFKKISAKGFGLMRIAWATVILIFGFGMMGDVIRYYSDAGMLPHTLGPTVFRTEYRFTILNWVTDPTSVALLYAIFLWCLLCMALGLWTRLMTILSVLLLFSFHERNPQILNAGDNLLRAIGFLLMIAPRIDAFSVDRLWEVRKPAFACGLRTGEHPAPGKNPAPLTMSIWPYRLLLWQYLIIYLESVWEKFHQPQWLDGSAIADILHLTDYTRLSKTAADFMTFFSPSLTWFWLGYETAWVLLLIPASVWNLLPKRLQQYSIKRWLLLIGLVYHTGIMIFMDVGAFSFVMFTGYLGLLLDEDIKICTKILKRFTGGRTRVLDH